MGEQGTSDQDLRALIAQLHARLSSGSLDAEGRNLVTSALHDIEQALARSDASAAPTAVPRLEALAVKFQADHPAVADGLRRLVDLLSAAGI